MSVYIIGINQNNFNLNNNFSDTNCNTKNTENSFFSNKNVTYTPVDHFIKTMYRDSLFDVEPQGINNRKVTELQDNLQNILEAVFISMIFFSLLSNLIQTEFNSSTKQNNIPKPEYTPQNNSRFNNEPNNNGRFNDESKTNNSNSENDYESNCFSGKTNDNTQQLNDALSGLSLEGKDIKDLSASDINSAYRKEARKWHPDKNPNNPAARAKFDALAEHKEFLLGYIQLNNSAS